MINIDIPNIRELLQVEKIRLEEPIPYYYGGTVPAYVFVPHSGYHSKRDDILQKAYDLLKSKLLQKPEGEPELFVLFREGISNGCFDRKRKDGEIVFSPYTVGRLTSGSQYVYRENLIFIPFDNWVRNTYPELYLSTDRYDLSCISLQPNGSYTGFGIQYVNDKQYVPNPKVEMYGTRRYLTNHSVEVRKSKLAYAIAKRPERNNHVITAALAQHNGKVIDVLTALAEGPKTVKMVIDAALSIRKALRTAIKNHDRWQKLYPQLKSPYTWRGSPESYRRYLAKKRAQLEIREERFNASVNKQRRDRYNLDNLLAQWLQYRYGVMPLVYTLYDAAELLKQVKMAEFVDTRKKETIERPSPLNKKATERIVFRCCARSKVTSEGLLKAYELSQFNPSVTAWELVPLSFVVDWFVNIGTVLQALNPQALDNVYVTYSVKVTCDYEGGGEYLKYEYYHRELVEDKLKSIRLRILPRLTKERLIDAFALSKLILAPRKK